MDVDYHTIAASAELLHNRIQNDHVGESEKGVTGHEKEFFDEIGESDRRRIYARYDRRSEEINRYVSFDRWPEDESLPEWIAEFRDVLSVLTTTGEVAQVPDRIGTEVPFEDIFWPIVEYSRQTVIDTVNTERLTTAGLGDFEQLLLNRLADVAAQALHIDFLTYINDIDPDVIRTDRRSPNSTAWYDEYVLAFVDGRAASFFEEFPMAAKLLTISIQQWQSIFTRFLSRLNDDLQRIRSTFDLGEAERIASVSPVGDAHGGGERVLLIEFEAGVEVLYKPRNVDPESAFYRFESWLCQEFETVPVLETPNLLNRDGYGWVEKIERSDHSEVTAVADYYRGVGALLCILYVLNVTDCHYENIIAAKESPVLVDPETVLAMDSSAVENPSRKMEQKIRYHMMNATVLGTGALPYDAVPEGSSGIDGIDGHEASTRQLTWNHINTDAMDIEYYVPVNPPQENFPTLAGEPARPERFVDQIVDGFESVYTAICGAKDRVKVKTTTHFDGLETRILLRSSRAYDELLKTLTSPKYLRSGAIFDYKLQEVLSMRGEQPIFRRETKLSEMDPERWEKIIAAEREALQRGDIPKFTVYSNDRGLYFDGNVVLPELTNRTGIDRLSDRISDMTESDNDWQRGLLRGSLERSRITDQAHAEDKI
ncbi:type 2 lanthipeptide synthetase LanM [Halopiger djelfimassiliensis]|uniref:type 2 lanthipeptide synthetase LanM n=1 Tax=Halopiger djelfimassiliensis TaxID=1293047 RepID=UPI0006781D7F|nr:type 2 lanthipeptide synthetase LanM [Halopiger djelfimassiliensis]